MFKKVSKVVISVTLTAAMAFSCCACSNSVPTNSSSAETSALTSAQNDSSEFYQKLTNLDGISSVEIIEQTDEVFSEKYMVTFTQPIDWDNPDGGYFEQRVELGYQGDSDINCFYVSGYCLSDTVLNDGGDKFKTDDRTEIAKLEDGNYINIEYRFFGDSVPEGLSNDKTDYWEYLTVENAARDFDSIIEKLSTILPGKRVFYGGSKGGFTTNSMAYFYPDLCDAYVSFSAPLCNGTQDEAFVKNIYETIGDNGYSPEEAAAMRQKMLDFQVLCIQNRDEMQEMCWNGFLNSGCEYREFLTKEINYDMMVINFAIQFWQYGRDFADLDNVLNMTDSTEDEHNQLIKSAYELLTKVSTFGDTTCTNSFVFPYYVQAELEMGENIYDFSYLRQAVIDKTGTDMLAITEDMEDGLMENLMFTDEQKAAFHYDDSLRNAMISWSQTTTAHVIMIYGGCDVWYAVRIPDTQNPNVHIFVKSDGCHSTHISDLAEEDKSECLKLLDEWLAS